MPFIYNADIYCDECGQKICDELRAAGKAPADTSNESLWDSDDYPKYAEPEATDTPQHCGCGSKCVNRFRVGVKGNIVKTGGTLVSALITEELTSYGVDYVIEAVSRGNPLSRYWAKVFDEQISSHKSCK